VLVVDEAGMVGSRQMQRVLEQAQAAGAKVVLIGDPEQLQAIKAGVAFRALLEPDGVAEISEMRWQRQGWQRGATRELATGKTAAALECYEQAGVVVEHATQKAALVEGWLMEGRRSPPAAS
jgi:ATP-dependent exoDNAse (exonuclease V) alpha subunit